MVDIYSLLVIPILLLMFLSERNAFFFLLWNTANGLILYQSGWFRSNPSSLLLVLSYFLISLGLFLKVKESVSTKSDSERSVFQAVFFILTFSFIALFFYQLISKTGQLSLQSLSLEKSVFLFVFMMGNLIHILGGKGNRGSSI